MTLQPMAAEYTRLPRAWDTGAAVGKMAGMKSYDVIRQAVEEPGVKAVAGALKVSPAQLPRTPSPT